MLEHVIAESVTDMFLPYGKVKLVRICSKESKGKLPHWLTVRNLIAVCIVPRVKPLT